MNVAGLQPGCQVGSYEILGRLGAGGMGTVYSARHVRIERRAAIKVLHPELSADPEQAERFLNEARATNQIGHPNIVNIFEVGQLEDGSAYIIMEYLEGTSLRHRLRWSGGRLGPSALRFARQIASGLAAAHAKGIIHRDLKPDNVMVVGDPETPVGERVKILDFGIAKLGTSAREEGVFGTPTYMAPEQWEDASLADGPADVYALGVILYQLLAGQVPFEGRSLVELRLAHLRTPPRPLAEIDPELPPRLVRLVHAMLAKAPRTRPSMHEVAQELDQFSQAPPGHPLPKTIDRRRLVWTILAAVGLTLLGLGAAWQLLLS